MIPTAPLDKLSRVIRGSEKWAVILILLVMTALPAAESVVRLLFKSSIPGAVLGALVLGCTESFGTGYISSDYEDVFAFVLLIVILIVKPSGLLGHKTAQKV